jgi:CheY-like chemotaxis protein
LRRDGYDVDLADTGEDAVRKLGEVQYDLVLTDLALGRGLSGMDVLRASKDARPETAVVMITAHGNEKVAVEAMKQGAEDYLPKPFDNEELRMVVARPGEPTRTFLITPRRDANDSKPVIGIAPPQSTKLLTERYGRLGKIAPSVGPAAAAQALSLRPGDVVARPEELMRGGIEIVHRPTSLLRRFAGVGGAGGDGLSSLSHLELGGPQGRSDLRRHQRILAAGLLHLVQHLLDPFFDGRLFGPGGCPGFTVLQFLLYLELTLGEPTGLRHGLIHGLDHLPAPIPLQLLAPLL